MISENAIRAGTVLHFDFRALRGTSPEFYDKHPVVVISPTIRQKDRTVIVVPLTSEMSNAFNHSAVEIFHVDLNRLSPTKHTFAICNLPVALALKRPSLDFYRAGRGSRGATPQPFVVSGRDLSRIRAAVVSHLYTPAALRSNAELRALVGASHDGRETRLKSVSQPSAELRSKPVAGPKSVVKNALRSRPPLFTSSAAGRLLFRNIEVRRQAGRGRWPIVAVRGGGSTELNSTGRR